MNNEIIIKSILKINPTAEVSVSDNDINTIHLGKWNNSNI
jgi:hypothetical protein